MSSVQFGVRASALLAERNLSETLLTWPSRAEAGTLVVATQAEWRELVVEDTTALLLLLGPGESPVAVLREAAIPVEVALLPLQGDELRIRVRWLLEMARPKTRGSLGQYEHVLATQRLALAGRVAAGAAHETRNALAYASLNLKFLTEALEESGAPEDGRLAQTASEALDGVTRALEASRFVLNLARGAPPERQPVDVNATVARTVRVMTFQTQGVRVDVDLGEIPPALADAGGLSQVVMNLMLNAVTALRSTGRILVRTASLDPWVLVSVSDSGPGISEELRARLFDAFVSGGGASGTGLGLTVSRSIIEAAKGRLEVLSSPLGGAEFRVLLPAA